jgi:hypothetical protein
MPARRAASSFPALSLLLLGALVGCGSAASVAAPEDIDLGPLYVGHTQTKVVTIRNPSAKAQRFKPLAFLAGGGNALAISSSCDAPLGPGASCDLTLQASPSAVGPIRAEVFVFGDRSDVVELDAAARLGALERALEPGDQHFVVRGEVQEAVLLKASVARLDFERDNDLLPFNRRVIEFKNVGVETSRQAPGSVVEGDLASRFEVQPCGAPIAPGESCSVMVAPKAGDQGDLDGTLKISGSPVKVTTTTKANVSARLLPAVTTKDLYAVQWAGDGLLAVGEGGTVLSSRNGKWKVEPNVGSGTLRFVGRVTVPETATLEGKQYTRKGAATMLMMAGDDGAFVGLDGALPTAVAGISAGGIPLSGYVTYSFEPSGTLRAFGNYTRSDGRSVGVGADGTVSESQASDLPSLSAYGYLGGSAYAWAQPGGHVIVQNYAIVPSKRKLELGENVTLRAIGSTYAVGDRGVVYRTSPDGDWVAVPSGITRNLNAVMDFSGSTVIAGEGVILIEKADKTFRAVEVPANLRAGISDGGGLLFVGDKGAIVHFP